MDEWIKLYINLTHTSTFIHHFLLLKTFENEKAV